MNMTMDAQTAKRMLVAAADAIISSKMFLTEIDNAIGDGDHGIGMSTGMSKGRDKLLAMQEFDSVYQPFLTMGKTMMMSMGGASGVMFGSLFMTGAKNKPVQSEMDAAGLAELFAEGLADIKKRGNAQIGDKTMVDALEPAVLAMQANSSEGFAGMLRHAEQAALEGVESTKNMIAKYGRAKFLMERAIGHQDAGATSVWIIIKAMREFAENN
jgi:dihydroxyacetone kinase phosphoprotein-dependent L subunit